MQHPTTQIHGRPSQQGLLLFLRTKSGEKAIGRIRHGTLILWRDERKHYFQTFGGFGIDKQLLLDSKKYQYAEIRLEVKNSNGKKSIYRVPRQRWIIFGKYWTDYHGWQAQIICPLSIIEGKPPEPESKPQVIQTTLFAGALP